MPVSIKKELSVSGSWDELAVQLAEHPSLVHPIALKIFEEMALIQGKYISQGMMRYDFGKTVIQNGTLLPTQVVCYATPYNCDQFYVPMVLGMQVSHLNTLLVKFRRHIANCQVQSETVKFYFNLAFNPYTP